MSECGAYVNVIVHFLGFALNYVNREYFFDIHPPLGKFILAISTYFTDFDREFKADKIGRKYEDRPFVVIRSTHAVFSAMMVPLPYLTLRAIGATRATSLLAGCMVLFDGCLISNGRSIFMDSFLWFFLALSIFASVQFWNLSQKIFAKYDAPGIQWYFWCILTGLALGCTLSVKWTGLGVVGVIGLRQLFTFFDHGYQYYLTEKGTPRSEQLRRSTLFHLLAGIIMLVLLISVYVALFALHFIIANHTGPGVEWHAGDTPYMQTFIGSEEYVEMDPRFVADQPSTLTKVWNIHKTMFDANRGIDKDHPWASRWFTWPFMIKGLMFWTEKNHMVYQLGNPLVWWGSTVLITLATLYAIFNSSFYIPPHKVTKAEASMHKERLPYTERARYEVSWLLCGYVCNLLPYVGVSRACWLYHYVPALFFGELAGCLWLDQLLRRANPTVQKITLSICYFLAFYGWYAFHQVIYCQRYTDEELEGLKWLSDWM
ncbi:hypothetical protein SARC_04443 [Sphaeroforma arctica JP610]|uniref:Uncharacterized protein n=1 Tax=Sphaeroforma arctica JP610 TaxID=667725 RepID=A0A0L0G360_9EUKA|nr:hypothetical protein SARC_04443 [Sphaeroforma arctica JP610]KNC83299.1 hypothetical protein SARC_04443 [Sphaeroforma arctica JP610]|eukprot:XP_014157201.1 hypothetical protein SARC_04443 [Sphaeroforma arctica JP610]